MTLKKIYVGIQGFYFLAFSRKISLLYICQDKQLYQKLKSSVQKQRMSSLPFALIIPGQAPITNFNLDNNIFHVDLENPSEISNICLTLTEALPENYALSISFSVEPYTQMQYLGAISNNRPSDIFSTGFGLKPQYANLRTIKICLQAKTFNDISQIVLATDGKKQYSKLVAQNLYNFMMSYNKEGMLINGVGDYLVVPSDCLNRWMLKFQQKYRKDPNFILKTTSG